MVSGTFAPQSKDVNICVAGTYHTKTGAAYYKERSCTVHRVLIRKCIMTPIDWLFSVLAHTVGDLQDWKRVSRKKKKKKQMNGLKEARKMTETGTEMTETRKPH